ncbi:MAG: hypothetical protein RR444_01955 [Oscillospiraceae bacterium]
MQKSLTGTSRENLIIKIDACGNIIAAAKYDSSANNDQLMNWFEIGNSASTLRTQRCNNINCVLYKRGVLRMLFLGEHSTVKLLNKVSNDINVYDDNGEEAKFYRLFFIGFITLISIIIILYYKNYPVRVDLNKLK